MYYCMNQVSRQIRAIVWRGFAIKSVPPKPQIFKFTKDRYWRYQNTRTAPPQRYDHFLILDFEATCDESKNMKIQEIIEFPCLKVNGITMKVEAVFHQYILPNINPSLTSFCTHLTGITQEMIDGQCDFQETLEKFELWMTEQGVNNDRSAFVISGDWDLAVLLPMQCNNENIPIPQTMTSWINIKQAYADATGYFPRGILDMMDRLNLKHTGRLHSGIDDSRNIALILKALASNDHIFHKSGYSLPAPAIKPSH